MSKVLDQIPKMKIRETLSLWHNALRILADKSKRPQHALAQEVVDAIGREWELRRRTPLKSDDFFKWPSTEARAGDGSLDTDDWLKEGVLQFMGYRVGNTDGEPQGIRERILAEIFSGPIPPVFPRAYLDEWGRSWSVLRLKKMAETIAALTRNAKRRRDLRMQAAVRDWEKDLRFLYEEYYVGKFQFGWPATAV